MASEYQINHSDHNHLRVHSAQEYANLVSAHARQSIADSLQPGQNYEDLSQYLLRPYQSRTYPEPTELHKRAGDTGFATLYDLGVEMPQRITRYHHVEAFDKIQHLGSSETGHMLFLRGNPTPEWLNTIGYKCNVDPEFFLRHMNFGAMAGKPNSFNLPCLPSSNNNFVRLRWTSIGSRTTFEGSRKNQETIERLRRDAGKKMAQYLDDFRSGQQTKTCDSYVRRFAVHDEVHFSLEQDVSVCINMIGKSWIIVVWQDVGNDLTEGPSGPWLEPTHHGAYDWTTRTLPTIQYTPYMALNARIPPVRSNSEGPHARSFPQSASLMSTNYGKFHDRDIMSQDAFYGLTELLNFTACSEVQFLNMTEAKLLQEEDFTIISNFLYNKKILDQHVQNLSEIVFFVRLHDNLSASGSSTFSSSISEKASIAAKQILKDFEYLHERAKQLSAHCDRGMNIVTNNNMLLESQRAIEQAAGVAKLTRLAFFYIPLSFTTSFFGMNFTQFGTGALSIWIWFVASIPVFLISVLFLAFDLPKCARRSWGFVKQCLCAKKSRGQVVR